ncbi:MAG: hypothetical protein AVDCRST_MAG87-994, partial [uncultured Thermomicrobiales bacterium]
DDQHGEHLHVVREPIRRSRCRGEIPDRPGARDASTVPSLPGGEPGQPEHRSARPLRACRFALATRRTFDQRALRRRRPIPRSPPGRGHAAALLHRLCRLRERHDRAIRAQGRSPRVLPGLLQRPQGNL